MALLALASCGYSTYYPHPVGFAVDTGAPEDPVPCGFAGATAVSLTMVSSIAETQQIFEVDPTSCAEVWKAELPSGGSLLFPTRGGVTWGSRRSAGELLGFFTVPEGVADWTESLP